MSNNKINSNKMPVKRLKIIRLILVVLAIFLAIDIVLISGLFLADSQSSKEETNEITSSMSEDVKEKSKQEKDSEQQEDTTQQQEDTPNRPEDIPEQSEDISGILIPSFEGVGPPEDSPKREEETTAESSTGNAPESDDKDGKDEKSLDDKSKSSKEDTSAIESLFKGDSAHKKTVIVLLVLLLLDIVAVVSVTVLPVLRNKDSKEDFTSLRSSNSEDFDSVPITSEDDDFQIALIHNIGARPYQEDSLGYTFLDDGVLTIVADGMGGLSAGDKVSKKIVQTMTECGKKLLPDQMDGILEKMVNLVNSQVNKMLGPNGVYKSGSTLLAVLVRNRCLNWISVGDSRIYFFRNGELKKLNQEHTVESELIAQVKSGEISYEEAAKVPHKERVTSFIGMGKLKYVDKSSQSIKLEDGDCIMLMTDGVFKTVSEKEITTALNQASSIQEAAKQIEEMVKKKAISKQDNFSALFIKF